MINSINNIFQTNYNTTGSAKSNKAETLPYFCGMPNWFLGTNNTQITKIRTSLTSKEEHNKYNTILQAADKSTRKNLEILLKNGILLNSNSDDKSTVLDNLYKIATTQRAHGLDSAKLIKDTVSIISNPETITQQFGNIPQNFRETVIKANDNNANGIDVRHSGTCVAASIEYNLAQKTPAEFSRFVEGLSSPKNSVEKKLELKNLTDNTLDSIWLLNAFEIPYKMNNFNEAELTLAPDKNALIRAQIQTADKDAFERSAVDVLMQSTFMQIGSQQSYNSLTDNRSGKFNQNPKGLVEFEKTFTESVVNNKCVESVTYQTVDENTKLIGYETDLDTMKKQLLTTLDMGENILIGYTQVDNNNVIINGHEITIVGYKKDNNGKLTFICNDTDDNLSGLIEYKEDYLLPKIHHAALPKAVLEQNSKAQIPAWLESLNTYKKIKEGQLT